MGIVVVTGAAGFLGSHIVPGLAGAGFKVRALDRLPPRRPFPEGVEFIAGEVGDRRLLEHLLVDVEVVFHLACSTIPETSEADRLGDIRSNVEPALALMEAAVDVGVRRLVFASSGGTIYGIPLSLPIAEDHPTRPISSHGVMKLTIEGYLSVFGRLHGLEALSFRMANPYGPGQDGRRRQGFVGVLAERVTRGVPVEIWGHGDVVRDFVFVGDVVDAFLRAAVQGQSGAYNIGSGLGHSLRDVVAAAEDHLRRPVAIRWLPARPFDVPVNVLDIRKAERELGWTPRTSLHEGIAKVLDLAAG